MSHNLIRHILNDPVTQNRVDRVLVDAKALPNLVGEELWRSLAFSGVAVGVESTMSIMRNSGTKTIQELRELLDNLTKIIQLVDDDEAIKMVSGVQEQLRKRLAEHANHLRSAVMAEANRVYEIEEDDMEAFVAGEADNMRLQLVGHRSFRSRADLFGAWVLLNRLDKAKSMKCMCSDCIIHAVHRLTTEDTKEIKDTDSAMQDAMAQYGGLSELYATYGLFLLDLMQKKIEEAQEGTEPVHEGDGAHTVAVDHILKSFSKRGGNEQQ